MTSDRLAVWLYGARVATIWEQQRRRIRLQYTPEAVREYPLGLPLLSLMLPLTDEPFPDGIVRPFLDGLLPEGDARNAIAADFRVRADDTYGLVKALGRDCAGALVIQPDEEAPPGHQTTLTAEPLTDTELAHLVENLRTAPLGVSERVRISLAGVQEKLLLTRMPGGIWGRPVDGTPSTHILKPEISTYPQTVENEAFCMRVAKHLGLPVAEVETTIAAGRRLLVVERYDRSVDASGVVARVHQEDFCQATGIPPAKKYEEDGGPSLRKIGGILQTVDPESRLELLRATALNLVIGNADAHGKNFSLLHERSGVLRLAPLYDVMSTLLYHQNKLAMYIDDVHRTDRVTLQRLLNEAATWGLSKGSSCQMLWESPSSALTD